MYIYLSNYRTSYRLLFIPWYKFAIPCLPLDWRVKIEDSTETLSSSLQSSQSAGGIDDPKKKSCGIFNLKGKRLPSVYPFHSIPSVRPSIHPIHPPILSIHPSILSVHLHIYLPSYLFTYLSTNLSIFRSIHLIIYFHTTLQSLGCMLTEDSRKNNLQSKEGYRGYRQQEALRSLQTDYKAKLHRFWHLLMQIAWPVSFSNFPSAADGHILLNAPDLFGSA